MHGQCQILTSLLRTENHIAITYAREIKLFLLCLYNPFFLFNSLFHLFFIIIPSMIIQLAPQGVVAHKYLEIYLFARN